MKSKITIHCCLCGKSHIEEIELPYGWLLRYDDIDEDLGFCPEHSEVAEWADSQCQGCVGGWGDCDLWRDFAHSKMGLTASDLHKIEKGACPRRTNGTFSFSYDGIEEIDLSNKGSSEAGKIFVRAILAYCEKHNIT